MWSRLTRLKNLPKESSPSLQRFSFFDLTFASKAVSCQYQFNVSRCCCGLRSSDCLPLHVQVKKTDSPDVVNIKTKAQEVIDSRKNVNNLVDIIAKLDLGEKTEVILAAVQGLKRVFVTLLEKGEVGKEIKGDGEGSEDKLKAWMSERLQEASKKLAALLYHPKTSITSLVLATITALLKAAYSAGGDANTWGQVVNSFSPIDLSPPNFFSKTMVSNTIFKL